MTRGDVKYYLIVLQQHQQKTRVSGNVDTRVLFDIFSFTSSCHNRTHHKCGRCRDQRGLHNHMPLCL